MFGEGYEHGKATGVFESYLLLVDCRPSKGSLGRVVELPDLIASLATIVEEELGVSHYTVPKFRGGQRLLASLIVEATKSGALNIGPGDVVIASSDHPAGSEVLDALRRGAALEIRGTR
jgi:hypothetical protein